MEIQVIFEIHNVNNVHNEQEIVKQKVRKTENAIYHFSWEGSWELSVALSCDFWRLNNVQHNFT